MASSDNSTSSSEPHPADVHVEPACILDVLLPDTIIRILKLLSRTPESIVAFSLSCSQLCSDQNLWTDLCRSITDTLPDQFRSTDWSPSAWDVGSHKELYICLLQPYRHLLQQRVWHTTKMAPGQLLVIDIMQPLIVGRSVSYTALQGGPVSHALFVVRLPYQLDGERPTAKGKARVFCCGCQPSEHIPAEQKLLNSMARAGQYTGLLNARHLAPAQLTFLHSPAAASVAAAASTAVSSVLEAAAAAAAAAAAEAAAAGGDVGGQLVPAVEHTSAQHSSPGSSSDSIQYSAAGVAEDLAAAGLSLCCTASCGSLYAELVSRWRYAEPHSTAVPPAGSSTADADMQSYLSARPPMNSNITAILPARGSNGGSNDGSSSSSNSLLLPDVSEFRVTPWDLRWIVQELDIPAVWRSNAVYTPFQPTPRLSPAAAGTVSTAAGDFSQHAAAAAVMLTGLWRGTYGSHGVELVQLQLLPVPASYQLQQQHRVTEGAVLGWSECPTGVLLQSVLRQPAPVVHPSLLELSEEVTEAVAEDPEQQQQQQEEVEGVSDGPDSAEAGGSNSTQQQQQLLLVATKVTGDRNVPAGQITFAVDLGSRSTAGAGQLLELAPGIHSDVKLNAPGTRPFVIKERYNGLAQIADVHFQSPRIIPVQLLVFEDPSCLGLLWKSPMDSFSLLSRLAALP